VLVAYLPWNGRQTVTLSRVLSVFCARALRLSQTRKRLTALRVKPRAALYSIRETPFVPRYTILASYLRAPLTHWYPLQA